VARSRGRLGSCRCARVFIGSLRRAVRSSRLRRCIPGAALIRLLRLSICFCAWCCRLVDLLACGLSVRYPGESRDPGLCSLLLEPRASTRLWRAASSSMKELSLALRSSESLLFGWPKRSNQEKGHPSRLPFERPCPTGPLRCLPSTGRQTTRPSLASDSLAIPGRWLRSSATS
jgi:hypothetical protein